MSSKIQKHRLLFVLFFVCVFIVGSGILMLQKRDNFVPEKHRLQWWLHAINWDSERTNATGEGIRVAILDSGVDQNHPDLMGKVELEHRVAGLQGKASEHVLHGTAVAGIIAGSPSYEKGILGIAVQAKIVSVDVTDEENGIIETSNLIEGIEYAISQKVDILNISAGVKQPSKELHQAVKKAYDAGIVIIAASGNYMTDDLLYPAKYEEVIAAGALSKDNEIISPKGNVEKTVVYLPGENIVTAGKNGGYTGINGTSASAPILSGIVALMKEQNRSITNDEILSYFNTYNSVGADVRKCMKLK